ncbi:major facilitator superfamily domain-containing protein [Plectosphaerella plurivora]|uniref:Major facilitator superfamily domain-containing protein n=1 Tax=Plectosphaerella plurivora TaxID=936078 RepID=A0A9P9AC31_9PEZI|nr:major facilitator superfamily domain-containing protein [Plectosphaerella plurivora]
MDQNIHTSSESLASAPQNEKVPSQDHLSSPESNPATSASPFKPDTRAGWIPVAAGSLSLFVYLGVIYSWGIMQIRLVETTDASLTTLTLVGSLATSFMISVSVPAAAAVRRGCLMGLGEFLASWVTGHIGALFVLHGLVFGVGGGLSIFACSTAHLGWFDKHRGLAMGVVFGGGSLGSAVMSVATNVMVSRLGVAWTFRILGFMLWGVCVPASWFRFREPLFLAVIAATVLSTFSLFIPPYFIPLFARSMGYSEQVAIVTLAAWNLASTVGRVGAGICADRLLGPLNSLLACLLLMGLSSLVVWPLSRSTGVFAVYLVLNGLGCGAFFSLVPSTLGQLFGSKNTMGLVPIVWTTWFCGFFFGTPIASGLYSAAGHMDGLARFRPAAFYGGGMSTVAFFFMLAIRFRRQRESRKGTEE